MNVSRQSSPLRVLVLVEQEPLAEVIKLTLNHGVCVARDARDASEATRILEDWRPEMAVIEIEAWKDQLAHLTSRSPSPAVPRISVLALTRRGDLKTKLLAFEQGVDDIMTVPFSPEELLARVVAITRRCYDQSVPLTPMIKVGDLEIDIINRQVNVGSSVLHLTGIELSLLYLLAANPGKVLTRDEIMDAIYGVDYMAESNVVDRHIRNLRAKLQNGSRKPRFIATVPGQGYRFLPSD